MSIDNLSWGNAGVFMLAWQATVVLPDSFAHYSVEWIIVGLTFVSGVILTVLPRLWEDPAEQRRELDIKYKAKLYYIIFLYIYSIYLGYNLILYLEMKKLKRNKKNRKDRKQLLH